MENHGNKRKRDEKQTLPSKHECHNDFDIINWLHERYEADSSHEIPKNEVYGSYLKTCQELDIKPKADSLIGKFIKKAFPYSKNKHYSSLGQRQKIYVGFRLRSDYCGTNGSGKTKCNKMLYITPPKRIKIQSLKKPDEIDSDEISDFQRKQTKNSDKNSGCQKKQIRTKKSDSSLEQEQNSLLIQYSQLDRMMLPNVFNNPIRLSRSPSSDIRQQYQQQFRLPSHNANQQGSNLSQHPHQQQQINFPRCVILLQELNSSSPVRTLGAMYSFKFADQQRSNMSSTIDDVYQDTVYSKDWKYVF